MYICNKCYWHRDLIHEPFCQNTEWEQKGPDFEEEEVPLEPASQEVADGREDEDEDSNSSRSSDSESDVEQ